VSPTRLRWLNWIEGWSGCESSLAGCREILPLHTLRLAADAKAGAAVSSSIAVSSQYDGSRKIRDTSAVCMACPARSATTEPSICFPISARSPIRSSTLWRTNSSAKRREIQHLFAVEHNGILGRRATDQSLLPHGIGLVQKPERARRGNLAQIAAIRQTHTKALLANQRMRKVDRIGNGIGVGRIHRDKLIALGATRCRAQP